MVKIRLKTLQPLHTRPLQSFKVIEDLTTALHQDIQRQYQNCMVMYRNTDCLDQAIKSSMEEMDNTVRLYESKLPYHACGEEEIKIWAGNGEWVKQAALRSVLEKAGAQPSNPHAIYKRVVTQLQEEIVWCDKCSVLELRTCGTLFNPVPSPHSLGEELDALDLGEEDRERAESWRGEERLTNGEAELGNIVASEETSGSSTETSEGNNEFTPSSEPVDQYYGNGEGESGVLLLNEYGCYMDSYGRCCCPRPPIVYL